MPPTTAKLPKCVECGVRAGNKRHGLCATCIDIDAVAAKHGIRRLGPRKDETEEELDRMIAEGLRNLPPWWEGENKRMASGEDV